MEPGFGEELRGECMVARLWILKKTGTLKLAFGKSNVTSIVGKELEFIHSLVSGSKLMVRDWTLSFSGVPQGERH